MDELFQTDEAKHLQAIPVKAARNDMNASIFYDETVKYAFLQNFLNNWSL